MSVYRFEKCHGKLEKNVVDYIDRLEIDAQNENEALELAIDDVAKCFSEEYNHADIDKMFSDNYFAYEA